MERVKLDEMRRKLQEATGAKKLNKDAAKVIFKDDDIANATGQERLSEWNHGKGLSTLRPRHILAMAKLYRVTELKDMFEA